MIDKNGLKKDTAKAEHWFAKAEYCFTRAAGHGDVESQERLAMAYEHGDLGKKNLETAFYWYQKAAEQGSSFAQYKVGQAYILGQGVKPDFLAAVSWYQKAAEQGNAKAIAQLKTLEDRPLFLDL